MFLNQHHGTLGFAVQYEVRGVSTIKVVMCLSIYTTSRYGCMAALGRRAMRDVVLLSTC